VDVEIVFATISHCRVLVFFDVQAKKQYEKAYREWEKVQEAHLKIEQDVYVLRVDIEKVS